MFKSARWIVLATLLVVTCAAVSAQTMDKANASAPATAATYFAKDKVT